MAAIIDRGYSSTGALLTVDLAFLGANMLKFVDGGWFPLVAGGNAFLHSWRAARHTQSIFSSFPPHQVFELGLEVEI